MLGGSSDDESGEEEVIGTSEEAVPTSNPPSTPTSAAFVEFSGAPAPEPLATCPEGWVAYRSSRYRDASQPEGYVYFHCAATGEVRWAIPNKSTSYTSTNHSLPGTTNDRAPVSAPSLYYPSPPPGYLHGQTQEIQRLVALSDGHVAVKPGPGGAMEVRYYCDQMKREKWAFFTDNFGLELLCHLVRCNAPALAVCKRLVADMDRDHPPVIAGSTTGTSADAARLNASSANGVVGTNQSATLAEGKSIYTEKKHLIQGVEGHKKVTWSQSEYAHPGMQWMYLTLKSWQRFTETWALLERATRLGLFEPHRPGGRFHGLPVRVLSIGGGPGFELLAMERFFRQYACASAPMQLVSLDLMPGWRPFVEAMHMQFGVYDIEDMSSTLLEVAAKLNAVEGKPPFPADTPGGHSSGVTYVLISYVMIYVSTDAVCDALAKLLQSGGAHCILVSERGEVTHSLGMMERRGIQVHRLIDQSNGLDERQSAWLSGDTQLKPPPRAIPVSFPNVPFEDGKARKKRRAE